MKVFGLFTGAGVFDLIFKQIKGFDILPPKP